MTLRNSLKQLKEIATETESEITFSEDGTMDWYWKSYRFRPKTKDIPKLIEAIKVMLEIGFEVS